MLFLSLLAAALLFFAFVRLLENTSLFFPSREILLTPRSAGIAFEEVTFSSEDGVKLQGWFIPNPSARRNLLYFQGNAGNMSGRIDKIRQFHAMGFNVLMFNYRGYGQSAGRPSEQGVYRDGRAAFDQLASRADVGGMPIVLYGSSIGGAVAIDVATRRKPAALITEATFSSMKDMARRYYPFVPSFMLSLRFDSDRKVALITCPKLFIHSPQDEIVPFALAQKLFASAAEPKEFLEDQGGHNDNFMRSIDKLRSGIERFLGKYGI
jgi:hypothetical protein